MGSALVNKWQSKLELKEWSFTTEEILPKQVTYGDYVPQKDRYFIGIEIDKENKSRHYLPRQRINRSGYNT